MASRPPPARSSSARRLPRAEDDVIAEQARVDACEPAGDEMELDLDELGEQRAQLGRGEEVQVRRVVEEVRRATEQELKTVLEAVEVRHRADERAAGAQDPPRL